MPWGLRRYQQSGDLHFVTFTCFQRESFTKRRTCERLVERALEQARRQYGFWVSGYVIMPEHVHLLVSEPLRLRSGQAPRAPLATALQAMKQSVARRLIGDRKHFWQARYYDFNVYTRKKRLEKLSYMHWNPVVRGLVKEPQEWAWSSFRHYLTGEEGVVEIESDWTARKRERMGIVPRAELVRNPVGFGDRI